MAKSKKLTVYPQTFDVEGSGAFPTDMLRYDSCFPATSEDVLNMDVDIEDRRTIRRVTLRRMALSPSNMPTEGRWHSFGWVVKNFKQETG